MDRVCTKCNQAKPRSQFSKCQKGKYGLQPKCKACVAVYYQSNRQRIKKNVVKWQRANRDKVVKHRRKWRHANPSKIVKYAKGWRKRHPDLATQHTMAYAERNPDYRGSHSLMDPKYCSWRSQVYERDDYTCQRCFKRGVVLNAHHIKSWNDYPAYRYDINNGITLCVCCHQETHHRR